MMLKNMEIRIIIDRLKNRHDQEGTKSSFIVPVKDGATVLQALQFIYENLDSTIAFEYSCRYGRCGLCGVMVNERSVLACTAFIRTEVVHIKPLENLPVVRDLVIDREPLEAVIKEHQIFYEASSDQAIGGPGLNSVSPGFDAVMVPDGLVELSGCLECLCCHSVCSLVDSGGSGLEGFAGPYIFLKLAQLHLDPRDKVDRKAQARKLGIDKCTSCKGCYCPQGIPLYLEAIEPLLA